MLLPLYMTYWVGMRTSLYNVCGTSDLKADETLQSFTAQNLTLGLRPFDTVIEACYWTIQTDTSKYHDTA